MSFKWNNKYLKKGNNINLKLKTINYILSWSRIEKDQIHQNHCIKRKRRDKNIIKEGRKRKSKKNKRNIKIDNITIKEIVQDPINKRNEEDTHLLNQFEVNDFELILIFITILPFRIILSIIRLWFINMKKIKISSNHEIRNEYSSNIFVNYFISF